MPFNLNKMNRMKSILIACLCLLPAGTLLAQTIDAITGETLKPEYLEQFRDDPDIRAKYNNSPWDNFPYTNLKGEMPYVTGEIMNPDVVGGSEYALRQVWVKEYAPAAEGEEPAFQGAFMYEGYALADLLSNFVPKKKNKAEFGLNTDVFVVVENRKGESAVFSWGELFFSKRGKDIILATRVHPVFPTNSDDRWEVPEEMKIVASGDFKTVRNIENPSRIIIRSFPREFPGVRGTRPLYAESLSLHLDEENLVEIEKIPIKKPLEMKYNMVFFGMHMGYRDVKDFQGYSFAEVLRSYRSFDMQDLKTGLIAIGAKDGYRVTFSLSEILNRTDLEEVMIMDLGKHEDGRFVVHPSADFFADRYMKGARLGYIITLE